MVHKTETKALLFDMDGTITDPHALPKTIGGTLKNTLESFGFEYNDIRFHDIFETNKGGGITKYYAKYLNSMDEADAEYVLSKVSSIDFNERVVQDYVLRCDAIFEGRLNEPFSIRPDIQEFIEESRMRGIKVAIVTNADPRIARANLKMAGIADPTQAGMRAGRVGVPIDLFLHRGDYGADENRKPSPYPYLLACERLGVHPLEAVGFEDSANGDKSLRAAGIGLRVHTPDMDSDKPIIFPHIEGQYKKLIPPHVLSKTFEGKISLLQQVAEERANRADNPALHAARRRLALQLPFYRGDEQFIPDNDWDSVEFIEPEAVSDLGL